MTMTTARPDYARVRAELAQPVPCEFGPALAAACALVATADGWPADEERAQLVARLRLVCGGGLLDLEGVTQAFDHHVAGLVAAPESAEADCLARVQRLRPDPQLARTLAHACNAVAMADGGYDEAERDAALRICRTMGLPPEEIGVADAR